METATRRSFLSPLAHSLARRVWDWRPQTPLEAIWNEIAGHAEKNPGWLEATLDS